MVYSPYVTTVSAIFLPPHKHSLHSLSTHFQTRLITTEFFFSPDTTPYLSTPQNAFHAQTLHAALLCVVTRCCSWPTARSVKMEVSCDMTSYFSRRYRRFGITNWLRGSLSYSEDLSRNFPQMLLLTYQNARCHCFDPPREAPDLDPSPNTKTVNALCLSNHYSL